MRSAEYHYYRAAKLMNESYSLRADHEAQPIILARAQIEAQMGEIAALNGYHWEAQRRTIKPFKRWVR